MPYWYILFVNTGREHHLSNWINQRFSDKHLKSFFPTRELFYKKSGNAYTRILTMFPGYLFIETEICSTEFLQHIWFIIKTSEDIIRILKYGDSDEITLQEDECRELKRLLNNDHCVELSVGFIEGDKIIVQEGPLMGRESIIKKINRHKREAFIDLEIMGGVRRVKIGLEVLKRI